MVSYKNKCEALELQVDNLNQELDERVKEIQDLQAALKVKNSHIKDLMNKDFSYGYDEGVFIFCDYLDSKGNKRRTTGYIQKEGPHHIKVLVHDKKYENVFSVLIAKDMVKGLKEYYGNGEESYKYVLELYVRKKNERALSNNA